MVKFRDIIACLGHMIEPDGRNVYSDNERRGRQRTSLYPEILHFTKWLQKLFSIEDVHLKISYKRMVGRHRLYHFHGISEWYVTSFIGMKRLPLGI